MPPLPVIYTRSYTGRFHNGRTYNPVQRGIDCLWANLITNMQYVAVDGPTEALQTQYIAYQVVLVFW